MKLYKVTDEDGCTRNDTQWGNGVTHKATGNGTTLCSDGFIHAYRDPILASLVYKVPVSYRKPKLWEAEGKIVLEDILKCGCKKLTVVKEIKWPKITLEQKVEFAILCALAIGGRSQAYLAWACGWLSGKDRTKKSADAAADAAYDAAASAAASARKKTVRLDFVAIAHTVVI